jgi:hypothetical protein
MGSDKLPAVAPIESHEGPQSSVPQVRPWVRYWARMFDVSLFGLLLGAVIAMFFPTAFSANRSDVGVQMLMLFGWVFVESLLLTAFGHNPGKTLFKTRLVLSGSESIPFILAFYRSLRVWWRGLGAGFMIVTLFTLWHAHTVLTRDSITSWDRELDFVVVHEKIGTLRVVIAVIWFGALFALSILGAVREMSRPFY